jgi:hypothetical protein
MRQDASSLSGVRHSYFYSFLKEPRNKQGFREAYVAPLPLLAALRRRTSKSATSKAAFREPPGKPVEIFFGFADFSSASRCARQRPAGREFQRICTHRIASRVA